jgi:anti-sigma regulatory factor (Ser/Thr protein kinase)/anti-anti-sigma regulatory factor
VIAWDSESLAAGRIAGIIGYAFDITGEPGGYQAARDAATAAPRRYEAARDVVAELQWALLPAALPVLPRARIAARYLVAAADQAPGGDWFDAVPLAGGDVALVVGEVAGYGVGASAAMGQLRAVLRHVLTRQPDLVAVLEEIEAVAAGEPVLRAATACVAVLDPEQGTLRYVTCGHPPPLVAAPDGVARYLPATGSGPLGTGSAMAVKCAGVEPGEVLLLYSDGLIEQPGHSRADGLAALAAAAGGASADRAPRLGGPASPAERVCQHAVDVLTRAGYGDDVTALAAQRLAAAPGPLAAELPAEPGTVVVLRRELDGWLDRVGIAEADRQLVELGVTEAVTNAVEHAYRAMRGGPVRLAAALGSDGFLEVRVADRGQWRTPDPAQRDRGQGLMLAGQIADELRVTHPPQDAARPPGARGTVVTLRHRLRRPAMLGSRAPAPRAVRPASAPFSAELVTAGPVPRVRVGGPVDATTGEHFSSRLLIACRAGLLPLTVDLTAATILASAGVRALAELSEQLAAHGNELTLVAEPGSPAAAVLDVVCLPRASYLTGPPSPA